MTPPSKPRMQMSQMTIRQARAYLDKRSASCPICRATSFSINPRLFTIPILSQDGLEVNEGAPLVMVRCNNCQNVQFHAAKNMGINPLNPSTFEEVEETTLLGTN